jgi:transposase
MIGLDTAKNVFEACLVDGTGMIVRKARVKRRQVLAFFAALPACTVVLEACGASYYWAQELMALGHHVKLVPPPFLKRYRSGHKNDARDAYALTLAGRDPQLRAVPVKTAEQQAAFLHLKVRSLLVRQHTQAANSLRGMLSEFGLTGRSGERGLEEMVERVETGGIELPQLALAALAILVRQWRVLAGEIEELTLSLTRRAKSDERSVRLMTVPGIGPVTASACVAKLDDATRFGCGRDFAAWLGLTPKQHSTAERRRLGSITKAGDEDLRSLFVLGAAAVLVRARCRPQSVDPWVAAIVKRKPFKVAAVALAARMARIAWALLRYGGVYTPRQGRLPDPQTA